MPTELTDEKLGERIDTLSSRANDLVQGLGEAPKPEDVKAVQEEMQALQAAIQPLLQERSNRLTQESFKSLTGELTNMSGAIKQLQDAYRLPEFGTVESVKGLSGMPQLYQDGKISLFRDIALATGRGGKAAAEAAERLEETLGGKAFTEGAESGGGYLVKPQDMGLLAPRERANPLFSLIPKVRVKTDAIEFVSMTNGLLAGWTAELAEKPLGDNMTFSTLQASVFTVAGLAVASNQLLEDSSIDSILAAELEKRVQRVIEAAILTGTGINQPLGLLNQPGTLNVEYDDGSPSVAELLVKIGEAIAEIQEEHQSEPTHILLSPRTWLKIITSADAEGLFTLGSGTAENGRRGAQDSFPQRTLYATPVVLTGAMPRDMQDGALAARGGGGNQTRIIVADMTEQLLMIRSEMAVDRSEHVFFTSNQTVFRGERRVGYTAARYPKSVAVIQGTGLVNTSF